MGKDGGFGGFTFGAKLDDVADGGALDWNLPGPIGASGGGGPGPSFDIIPNGGGGGGYKKNTFWG